MAPSTGSTSRPSARHGAALRAGLALEVRGSLRRSHDVALVDRAAVRSDGAAAAIGSRVMQCAPGGRIADVVGIA